MVELATNPCALCNLLVAFLLFCFFGNIMWGFAVDNFDAFIDFLLSKYLGKWMAATAHYKKESQPQEEGKV